MSSLMLLPTKPFTQAEVHELQGPGDAGAAHHQHRQAAVICQGARSRQRLKQLRKEEQGWLCAVSCMACFIGTASTAGRHCQRRLGAALAAGCLLCRASVIRCSCSSVRGKARTLSESPPSWQLCSIPSCPLLLAAAGVGGCWWPGGGAGSSAGVPGGLVTGCALQGLSGTIWNGCRCPMGCEVCCKHFFQRSAKVRLVVWLNGLHLVLLNGMRVWPLSIAGNGRLSRRRLPPLCALGVCSPKLACERCDCGS